jgi:hypothetical protein
LSNRAKSRDRALKPFPEIVQPYRRELERAGVPPFVVDETMTALGVIISSERGKDAE